MTYESFGSARGDADDVVLSPPPYLLSRLGAVVLDPTRAVALPGVTARPTVYTQTRLVADATVDPGEVLHVVRSVAEQLGTSADVDGTYAAQRSAVGAHDSPVGVTRLTLSHRGGGMAVPPDAWMVLQSVRERLGVSNPVALALGLDHVLQSTATGGSNPFTHSNPFAVTRPYHDSQSYSGSSNLQLEPYGTSGFNPVAWLGEPPQRHADHDLASRRPVVAVLDTGCGRHVWLDAVVRDGGSIDGRSIGYSAGDPESEGDLAGSLDTEVDSYAGHGTFVAGLVHLTCPDADILSYRVLDSDGSVVESDFLGVLVDILEGHRRAVRGEPGGQPVDVLLLTCGYYHETPTAELGATALARILRAFGQLGVVVVAAAGNDATTRPMFPAGIPGVDEPDAVPVIAVGALNPDRTSVALFSNAGPWVRAYRAGVACVSTMPALRGGIMPLARTSESGRVRASVDPDDFGGGFATGSGTSFAAAVFAGELAGRISATALGDVDAAIAHRRNLIDHLT